jgi:hypothetical protein
MRSIGSVWRGIRAMSSPLVLFKYWAVQPCRGFWLQYWSPIWHEGKGPYISVGLGVVGIYRGY